MDEPGWISFASGAYEVQKRSGVGWAEACRRVRAACRDELITTMTAPYDDESQLPREFWKAVAPSEWRRRDVDYEGSDADGSDMVAMLKEDDFHRWLAAKPKAKRASPMDRLAREALADLKLAASVPNKEAHQRVGKWVKTHGGHQVPSKSVIARIRANKSGAPTSS